jgi:hypothetical protein
VSGPSRVNATRAAAASRAIDTTPPTVVGAVGITQRGPFADTLVTSYAEYQQNFGGPSLNSADMDLAVSCFFTEGGQVLHIARVVHYTDPTNPASRTSAPASLAMLTAAPAATSGVATSAAGPFALASGDQLTFKVDGGSVETVTFTGTAASRQSAAGTFALADGDTLTMTINGVVCPTMTFHTSMFVSISAALPSEVVAAFNAYFATNGIGAVATVTSSTHVTITSTILGTSSGVNITGGTANAGILAFTTGNIAGTGNVGTLAAVLASEVVTAILGVITGGTATSASSKATITSSTTGGSSSVQVTTAGAAGAKLGYDNAVHTGIAGSAQSTLAVAGKTDGSYANFITLQVAAASNGASDHFNLYVLSSGVIAEQFFNLSLNPGATDYALTVVNSGYGTQVASNLVALTDDLSTVPSPGNLPAVGTFGPMTGGSDGLASLADADYQGATSTSGATGMHLFDQVEDLDVLIVPGRATSATANAQITYCEVVRGGLCFTILDPPAGLNIAAARIYFGTTAAVEGLSQMSAAYYPRILVDNPNPAVFGSTTTLTAAPSGAIAGLYARLDASKDGGAFEQPASIETGNLITARGLEAGTDVRVPTNRGLLFDDRVNPIMSKTGQPIFVDGARTLSATGPFSSVGESRGVLFLQHSIIEALDPKRNQNNRPRLRNEINMSVSNFMHRLTTKDCFATNADATAWFFDVGDSINQPVDQAAGNVNARLGVATSKPAEFINVVVSPFVVGSLNNALAAA